MDTALPPVNKVVLLGANGSIGRGLSPVLGAAGLTHRVVGRNHLALQIRFQDVPLCEHYTWDPSEKDAFVRACAGFDTAVYLIGSPLWKYRDMLPLVERALMGAHTAGVSRFLLVSSNWSYTPSGPGRLDEDAARNPPSVKGRIRRDQEDRVLAAHAPGVFATAVLRIADLYGPRVEASPLWSAFQAAKRGTLAHMLGPIDRAHEFVFVSDAIAVIARLLSCPAAWSGQTPQALNLGGVGLTTVQEMTELIFATEGKPPRYEVPKGWLLALVRSLNPYIRELKEMQYLQEQPIFLDDSRLAALLAGCGAPLEKTAYAEGIRQTLALR